MNANDTMIIHSMLASELSADNRNVIIGVNDSKIRNVIGFGNKGLFISGPSWFDEKTKFYEIERVKFHNLLLGVTGAGLTIDVNTNAIMSDYMIKLVSSSGIHCGSAPVAVFDSRNLESIMKTFGPIYWTTTAVVKFKSSAISETPPAVIRDIVDARPNHYSVYLGSDNPLCKGAIGYNYGPFEIYDLPNVEKLHD